jgi:CheY-like chemotaxis protein
MSKILYVEDDPINALVMQRLLKEFYEVVHVSDGESCLALLDAQPVDLVLMDINLGRGNMDGVETLHRLRANPKTEHLKVITVTSYALPEDEDRFRREGFDGYLAKPISRKPLLDMLQQYLH